MKKFIPILMLFLTSCNCTYTINLMHTEGEATETIDEAQTADPSLAVTPSAIK